jgi:sugar phosphate isomerase/epimerase
MADQPRVSCSTASLYHLPLATALRIIRSAGFDGAEYVVGPDMPARGIAWVERVFARADLPALSFHPPLYPIPGWPWRNMLAGMLRVVHGARRLGCEVAVVHAPRARLPITPRMQRYVRSLDLVQTLAAGSGIAIGLETTQRPSDGRAPLLMDDLDVFVSFADQHHVGVTLDVSHALANGDDLLALLDCIGSRLVNVHYSDCRRRASGHKPRTHLLPGTGGDPALLTAFTQELARCGYTGPITLEVSPLELGVLSPRTAERRLSQACAFVRAALAREDQTAATHS